MISRSQGKGIWFLKGNPENIPSGKIIYIRFLLKIRMKKSAVFSLLVFAVFIFGFVSLVSAAGVTNVARFGRSSPVFGYNKVSNDTVVVYGASSYQLGEFTGTPYVYFVNISNGNEEKLGLTFPSGVFPGPISSTGDYFVITNGTGEDQKFLFYSTKDAKLKFAIDGRSFADVGSRGNCSVWLQEQGQSTYGYSNITEVPSAGRVVWSEGNTAYYLVTSPCVGYDSGNSIQMGWGSVYIDSINIQTMKKQRIGSLLWNSNPQIVGG